MSENATAERFTERPMEHRSEEPKEQYRKSFKLGEGEYGEGDELVGVRMGQVFELANKFIEMAGMSEDANDVRGLDALAGEWSMEAVFPFDPPVTGRGRVSFEWLSEGSFLVQRWEVEHRDAPDGIAIIGPDGSDGGYRQHYFDTRGVSRVYEMSLRDGVWKLWRDSPGFSQRFTGTFGDDGNTITGFWEKSGDGEAWEHDFDLAYTKQSETTTEKETK